MIKAVVFDMYETLVTQVGDYRYKGREIARDIGISEQKFREVWDTTDEDRTLGRKTLEEVIEEVLKINNCYSTELFEKIIRKRKKFEIEPFWQLNEEIISMFEELKKEKMKLGLITNCYFEEKEVIEKSRLYKYFDVVCMSCELGIKKPDVRIFYTCTDKLNVLPGECLYVGDGGSEELEAAKIVGMHPLQAAWYLKDGADQPTGRKKDFLCAENPMEVCKVKNMFDC